MEQELKQKERIYGLTQEQLSELIDFTPSYVSEIERGGTTTSLSAISKISQVLDVSLDYLVFGINKNNSDAVFTEIFKSLPKKNHDLYINLCDSIAKVLK